MTSTTTSNSPTATTNASTTTNETAAAADTSISKDELLELVKAIKFAKPDASMRAVHREITQQLSQNEGFEFLATAVALNDVKKVWKKAVTAASNNNNNNNSSNSSSSRDDAKIQSSLGGLKLEEDQVLKLYTVGDSSAGGKKSSLSALSQEYSQAAARAVAEQAREDQQQSNNFVHVFLDVAADMSGRHPHQALINFQDQQIEKQGKSNKKNSKKSSSAAANSNGMEIVKIQVAAAIAPGETTKHPMLLYNQDKSSSTFIHSNQKDKNDGYDRIRSLIEQNGIGGALGNTGGQKAYFFARKTINKVEGDVLSISVQELAPTQGW